MTAVAMTKSSQVLPWKPYAEAGLGIVMLLVFWQLTVNFAFSAGGIIPSPAQILRQFFIVDGPAFYFASAGHTLHAALQGWCWGNLIAIGLALLVGAIPRMEKPVLLLGAIS
jgi:ABC-type nitrate/sulfonate/bicarbonate transport system permease component